MENFKIKKMLLLFAIILSFSFVGCQKETKSIVSSDGTPLSYNESDLPQGVYILKDKKYYSLLNLGSSMTRNYIWYTGYDKAIPTLEKGDKLIIYTPQSVPSELQFAKLNDFGYTLGIKFKKRDQDGFMSFPKDNGSYNPTSPVSKVIGKVNSEAKGTRIDIKEVNGKEFKETMLSVDGFMKGLTKDAMYKFYYYQGTIYKDVSVKADTHVFLKDYTLPSGSYDQLKDKTFIVNLPSSIEDGFWHIEGYGMFRYIGDEDNSIKENTKTNSDNFGDEETPIDDNKDSEIDEPKENENEDEEDNEKDVNEDEEEESLDNANEDNSGKLDTNGKIPVDDTGEYFYEDEDDDN